MCSFFLKMSNIWLAILFRLSIELHVPVNSHLTCAHSAKILTFLIFFWIFTLYEIHSKVILSELPVSKCCIQLKMLYKFSLSVSFIQRLLYRYRSDKVNNPPLRSQNIKSFKKFLTFQVFQKFLSSGY